MADDRVEGRFWSKLALFCIVHKRPILAAVLLLVGAGLTIVPFSWRPKFLPGKPLSVDAIPDLGENQQIVFSEWPGRSPVDVDEAITHPLTVALLGTDGVRVVRGSSIPGASSVYVIFDDTVGFAQARRLLSDKLAALPQGTLPEGVVPALGPEATALGQVFWYTVEARDTNGEPATGWDLHELRQVQDTIIAPALEHVPGVAEVASIGGHTQEVQVDVDPLALTKHGVSLEAVVAAVHASNAGNRGARTLEINRVEYMVRGLGSLRTLGDLEAAVVHTRDGGSIALREVAHIGMGPALRRGALDHGGAEAVGGVVVARQGTAPLEVLNAVHDALAKLAPTLPGRSISSGHSAGDFARIQVTPFYDRSRLIEETLGTLSSALWQQILVTVLTVLLLLRSLRGAFLITLVLPLAVLVTFLAMKIWGVEVNVMALAGIAIAIGTMVDMAIVLSENIMTRLRGATASAALVADAAAEVAPAVLTAGITTAVSFAPVFAFTGAEGKLFAPLAYTKTFAMLAALLLTLVVLPSVGHWLMQLRTERSPKLERALRWAAIVAVVGLLMPAWQPLGPGRGVLANGAVVIAVLAMLFLALASFRLVFPALLRAALEHKAVVVGAAIALVATGALAWLGFDRMLGFLPQRVQRSRLMTFVATSFPGFGREFMPPFNEGSYMYMPTMTDHGSITQSLDMLHEMDAAIASVPEVGRVVGKLGRVDSALDPAPISMFETIISYVPEYVTYADGKSRRLWRPEIKSERDIWAEIVRAAKMPGLTSAPMLMPIQTRVLMLQTGVRAALAVKLYGDDLTTLQAFAQRVESAVKQVPQVRASAVIAETVASKPSLEVELDRAALLDHGLTASEGQDLLEVAQGGLTVTHADIGAKRYPVRVRYGRQARDGVDALAHLRLRPEGNDNTTLSDVAHIRYVRAPQVVTSEDGKLMTYVVFDAAPNVAEIDAADAVAEQLSHTFAGTLPAGAHYELAGSYQNHHRAMRRLLWLVPASLLIMMLLVHLEFRRLSRTLIVTSSIAICVAGGLLLVWLWGKPWFLRATPFGVDLREVFQVGTVNLSVAVWVGFIALLGIATDAGVVMGIYLCELYAKHRPTTVAEIRALALQAAERRLLPCMMTTAAAALSLLPTLTTRGRGSDVMLPMALPSIGGMITILLTLLTVPVLLAWLEERKL